VGVMFFGNKYSIRLHLGISTSGKGDEKGMLMVKRRSRQYEQEDQQRQ
jgi:hypothetical protein